MTYGVVVAAGLVGLGYFPARLVTGTSGAACLVSPLVSGLLVTVFSMVCVLAGLSMRVAVVGAVVVAIGCGARLFGQRSSSGANHRSDSWAVLLVPVGGLVAFATVLRPPVAWDARSIWWFHAHWFQQGGAAVVAAMRNPAFSFSHPDYPPFAPATNAAAWLVDGTQSAKHAQIVTALLTLSAVSVLGYAVWRLFATRLGVRTATAAGCLVVAASYGVARVDPATNGYVDVLWAASIAAACVFLLASPQAHEALRWGALMLAVAALTKNEGLVAASFVAVLTVIRYGLHRRIVSWLSAGLAPGAAWLVMIRILGVVSESADQSRTGRLFALDPVVTSRIGPAARSVADHVGVVTVAAAALSLAGLALVGPLRRKLGGSLVPWMWIAWLGTVGSLAFAYVVSSRPLAWHLRTSVSRTTIAPNLVLLAEGAIWTLTVAVSMRRDDRPGAEMVVDRAPEPVGGARPLAGVP